jgi:hypothetical protein
MTKPLTPRQQQRKDKWEIAHPPRAGSTIQVERTPRQRFARSWTKVCAIIIAVALVLGEAIRVESVFTICLAAAGIASAAIIIPWILWGALKIGGVLGDNVATASRPIPSPAEISWQLQQEWGRPATLEEVAVVHQMLTSEKNQALLTAGVGFGALYLAERNLHGL